MGYEELTMAIVYQLYRHILTIWRSPEPVPLDPRKEFNLTIRDHTCTSHPDHHLQRLVEKGYLKHKGKGIYELA